MKNRSTKFWMIAVAALGVFSSCNDDEFLDKIPAGQAVEDELSVGGFDTQAFGLYAKFRTQGGIADWSRYWFQSIRSDDAAKGSTVTDAAGFGTIFDAYQYSAVEGFAASNWSGHFNLIYDCNDLILDVDDSGDTGEGTLINKAEAMAFRALCFFELRRDYGEVPLVLNRVESPIDAVKPKASISDIDAQIMSDLQYAIEHLPTSWPAYPGRLTKGMAQSLLGKLHLYRQEWTQALTQFEAVISSGNYGLYGNFSELFLQKADNSVESIFEVQFTRIAGVNYSSNYWESQGVRGSSTWDLGWGFNVPTEALVNAFEPGDPRKAATILYSGQDDGYGNIVPEAPPLAQPYWNKKAYTLKSERDSYGENKNHWANIRIIRYADVLLMAAEAANESGQTAVATGYLNQVRARARGNTGTLPDVTSGDQGVVRAAIKQERRVELALEGERFYDLVRWGDAVSVLGGLGYQDKNKFYPIPQGVVDESQGVIAQNPNY